MSDNEDGLLSPEPADDEFEAFTTQDEDFNLLPERVQETIRRYEEDWQNRSDLLNDLQHENQFRLDAFDSEKLSQIMQNIDSEALAKFDEKEKTSVEDLRSRLELGMDNRNRLAFTELRAQSRREKPKAELGPSSVYQGYDMKFNRDGKMQVSREFISELLDPNSFLKDVPVPEALQTKTLRALYEKLQKDQTPIRPLPSEISTLLAGSVGRLEEIRILQVKQHARLVDLKNRFPAGQVPQELTDLLECQTYTLREFRDEMKIMAYAFKNPGKRVAHHLKNCKLTHTERTKVRPTVENEEFEFDGSRFDDETPNEDKYAQANLKFFEGFKGQEDLPGGRHLKQVIRECNLSNLGQLSTPNGLSKHRRKRRVGTQTGRGRNRGRGRGRGRGYFSNYNFRGNNRGRGRSWRGRGGSRGRGNRSQRKPFTSQEIKRLKTAKLWLDTTQMRTMSFAQKKDHYEKQRNFLLG